MTGATPLTRSTVGSSLTNAGQGGGRDSELIWCQPMLLEQKEKEKRGESVKDAGG